MREMMVMRSSLGNIRLEAEDEKLVSLNFTEENFSLEISSVFLLEVRRQLKSYLDGDLRRFDFPIESKGTVFQKKVWQKVSEIPYGRTCSYETIAHQLESKNGARAVGAANGDNPLLIVVPCHRVISKSGALTGYAGGLWRKVKLLQLEMRDLPGNQYCLGF
ncbi:methylated-DNA--[protein]-cysteine S-methyltransferase [Litoribacter alkaliphilus]|uniref:Methylated-DNA--protein-cysteine methyltransferase n=1 Tax=Litoribacter ruber TaxID=702568 RepID=A0AAP2CFW5_9BACT|nr:methylated-DNA--[protein]-cysteine S-methyltransferase [Litoribacter alkaliphilus]MBS9523030.1 methylated-DNA--[protein]-cysteine S-methyltransferase [Litoribacter alkaliphilus]